MLHSLYPPPSLFSSLLECLVFIGNDPARTTASHSLGCLGGSDEACEESWGCQGGVVPIQEMRWKDEQGTIAHSISKFTVDCSLIFRIVLDPPQVLEIFGVPKQRSPSNSVLDSRREFRYGDAHNSCSLAVATINMWSGLCTYLDGLTCNRLLQLEYWGTWNRQVRKAF
jgi:hypothetical protein